MEYINGQEAAPEQDLGTRQQDVRGRQKAGPKQDFDARQQDVFGRQKAGREKGEVPSYCREEGTASREVEVKTGHQDVHLTRRCPIRSGHLRVIARIISARVPLAHAHSGNMRG